MVAGKPGAHILSHIQRVLVSLCTVITVRVMERSPDKVLNPRCFCSRCQNFTMPCFSGEPALFNRSEMSDPENSLK